jgi:hypothetical protein
VRAEQRCRGQGIITTDRRGNAGYQSGDYTTVDKFGGTSSAAPLVAGLCALILSVNPELTAAEVKDILKITTDKIDPANGNYNAEGHSRNFSYGRINAHQALEEARRRRSGGNAIERIVKFESTPNLAIPDNRPVGVADTIVVAQSATVQSVGVDVQINHSYRGDLKIHLVAPNGTSVGLFGRTGPIGDNRDDLVASFAVAPRSRSRMSQSWRSSLESMRLAAGGYACRTWRQLMWGHCNIGT